MPTPSIAAVSPDARRACAGFSLLEVLASLAIAVILVFTASSALMTVLRGEETAEHLRRGTMLVHTLASRQWTGRIPPEDMEESGAEGWALQVESVSGGTEEEPLEWSVWKASPPARPSLTITVAFRAR